MQTKKPGELSVVLMAKELCKYVLTVTQKSPKQYRFTYTTRLQNLAMDVIEELYLANETYVAGPSDREQQKVRRNHQHTAMTKVRMLAFFAQTALEQKVILLKQYERISKLSFEVLSLTGAWLRSDRRRYSGEDPKYRADGSM